MTQEDQYLALDALRHHTATARDLQKDPRRATGRHVFAQTV